MSPPPKPSDRLVKLFHRRQCWLLADLAQALDCALVTVRRLLKQVGYFRSFSDNGKWYTLRRSPHFNREGLWRHRGIGFSKHGSLTATIGHLVGRSPAGLSARELSQKLQHPCLAVLSILHKGGAIDRVKVDGQFRYLATAQPINRRQRQLATAAQPPRPADALTTQAAVFVLVEYIKQPELSFQELAAVLQQQRQLSVAPESIHRFFREQGLKKTAKTSTPRP
jgi:transposase